MRFSLIASIFLVALPIMTSSADASYQEAVASLADQLAKFLHDHGEQKVVPDFTGLIGFPDGGKQGFVELLKEKLAPHDIVISRRANLQFTAFLKKVALDDGTFALRLMGRVMNIEGEELETIEASSDISDGREMAEVLGHSAHFGSSQNADVRRAQFVKYFSDPVIYQSNDRDAVYSNQQGLFGLSVRVNGRQKRFIPDEAGDGLAYMGFGYGDEYAIVLHNNSDHEIAVRLYVDGVNVFHFSDLEFRTNGGDPLYNYFVVGANTKQEVVGWYRSPTKAQRFKTTSIEEGAAYKANIPIGDVGLVTATFCASWTDKDSSEKPRDEPEFTRELSVTKLVPHTEQREGTRTVSVPNGDGTFRTEQVAYNYTVTVCSAETETRLSTGFGEEVRVDIEGVSRTIGVPRGTVAFRYQRRE